MELLACHILYRVYTTLISFEIFVRNDISIKKFLPCMPGHCIGDIN